MTEAVFAKGYAARLADLLLQLPFEAIADAIRVLEQARTEDRTIFLAGNGGSAATATHMANDLMKTVPKRGEKAFRAISLSDNAALMTAIANDESYDVIFSEQLAGLGAPGDVLIAITGSGNSPNILRVVQTASSLGMRSIGILGMDGGRMLGYVDVPIVVPSYDYGPIEDMHMVLDHLITEWFQRAADRSA